MTAGNRRPYPCMYCFLVFLPYAPLSGKSFKKKTKKKKKNKEDWVLPIADLTKILIKGKFIGFKH